MQLFLDIFATVRLVQKGSPEFKSLGQQGTESDREQKVGEHADEDSPGWARSRGFRLALYSRSLGIVMGVIFAFSWLAQSIAGRSAFNEQLADLQDPVSSEKYEPGRCTAVATGPVPGHPVDPTCHIKA